MRSEAGRALSSAPFDRAAGVSPDVPRHADWRIVAPAAVLLLGGMSYLAETVALRQAALYLLGAGLGLVLYHAAFGFSSSWRALLTERRGAGLRAQILMLGLASVLFLPILATGELFGRPVAGAVAPLGVSVLVGAFLFGTGMQLGGGCASGTLYSVGGGSPRMVVTLAFFLIGSLLGSAHIPWWLSAPSLGSVSLLREFGLAGALTAQLGVLALIASLSVVAERRRHGSLRHGGGLAGSPPHRGLVRRALHGPWPLVWAAVLLAVLNLVTLGLTGHPWSVSFGYTLWGAKIAAGLGFDVAAWEFWTWPYPKRSLAGSLFAESTSVMNLGILVGAFLAAGLAGKFAPLRGGFAWRPVLAAALGGILMGYGARLAFGCNIGAFFSGIASGSLHGWLWFVAALIGTYAGVALRPAFGLAARQGSV